MCWVIWVGEHPIIYQWLTSCHSNLLGGKLPSVCYLHIIGLADDYGDGDVL